GALRGAERAGPADQRVRCHGKHEHARGRSRGIDSLDPRRHLHRSARGVGKAAPLLRSGRQGGEQEKRSDGNQHNAPHGGRPGGGYLPTMTSDALMIADASLPTLSWRSSTASLVIDAVTTLPPMSIRTCAVVCPFLTSV